MKEPAPAQAEKSTATVQALLRQLLDIYDAKTLASLLVAHGESHWSPAILKRLLTSERAGRRLSEGEFRYLQNLLPRPSAAHPNYAFRFIDLFAGIGGIRHGFEAIGGQCVFTSEWNKHAVRTYKANWYCDPHEHHFNADIRDVTLSHKSGVSDEQAAEHIRQTIPAHDVLLAAFRASLFRWPASPRRMPSDAPTVSPAIRRERCFLTWRALLTPVVQPFLYWKTSKT